MMKIEIVRSDQNLIDQVVKLGTKNSKTLGHFPEGAYLEHANRGYIICSFEKRQLLGFLLFSITQSKNSIRVIQLCISENARQQGVAKLLLDFLKNRFNKSLKGITLSCRTDYTAASKLWEKYGFKAMAKVRSRSKKENYLYRWWYDFGNHDLFSISQASSSKIKAVLDANIIIKLRSNQLDEISGTRFLLEDWLIDLIDFYYAPEIYNEIKRDQDDERAQKTRSFLSHFSEVKFKRDAGNEVFKAIDGIISGSSENDLSDKKQLSECIASGIPYFITTDHKLLDADDEINRLFGTHILRPIDIILLIDADNNKADYLSTRIAGVNYDFSPLKSGEIEELIENIQSKERIERKHELRAIFTHSSSNVKQCKTKILRNRENKILGVLICDLKSDEVTVPLIRTTRNNLADTLFAQLTFEAINFAISNGRSTICISDKYIESQNEETLESMGFTLKDDVWLKIAAKGIISSSELFSIPGTQRLFEEVMIRERLMQDGSNEFFLNLERKLWPIKFDNIDIPSYIIPIKPHWASQLFDHYAANDSIFGAKASLAWSRENVYYRNVRPVTEKTPARLLWYSSSTKDKGATRFSSIVACSYLEEVHVGRAKELFRRFRNYGIYEWKNIFELANNNPESPVKVLKFRDTEVFRNAIPFKKVTNVFESEGRKKNTFTGPVEISTNIFIKIYKLGL